MATRMRRAAGILAGALALGAPAWAQEISGERDEVPAGPPRRVVDLRRAGGVDAAEAWPSPEQGMWARQWWMKPSVALGFYDGDDRAWLPLQVGVAGGRRYWELREGPRWAADLIGRAEVPLGGAYGSYVLEGGTSIGVWAGPVRAAIGPMAHLDRFRFDQTLLPWALSLGARTEVSVDFSVLHFYAAVEPAFLLPGPREPVRWRERGGGVGHELHTVSGLGVTVGWFRVSVDLSRRATAIGDLYRAGVGVRLRPF